MATVGLCLVLNGGCGFRFWGCVSVATMGLCLGFNGGSRFDFRVQRQQWVWFWFSFIANRKLFLWFLLMIYWYWSWIVLGFVVYVNDLWACWASIWVWSGILFLFATKSLGFFLSLLRSLVWNLMSLGFISWMDNWGEWGVNSLEKRIFKIKL